MGRNSKKKKSVQNPQYKKVVNEPVKKEVVEKVEPAEEIKDFTILEYEHPKCTGITEQKVLENAMRLFDTFEGNLKADHSETHFKFTKIRG